MSTSRDLTNQSMKYRLRVPVIVKNGVLVVY